MFGQPGNTDVSTTMPKTQPHITLRPSTTSAAPTPTRREVENILRLVRRAAGCANRREN
jgi:hypothetical protein